MAWGLKGSYTLLGAHTIASFDKGEVSNGACSFKPFNFKGKPPREVQITAPGANQVTIVYPTQLFHYKDSKMYEFENPATRGYLNATFVTPNISSPNPRLHFEELFFLSKDNRYRHPLVKTKADVGVGMLMKMMDGAFPAHIRDYLEKFEAEQFMTYNEGVRNQEIVSRLEKLQDRINAENDLHELIRFLKQ